jgi:hypothetical protein
MWNPTRSTVKTSASTDHPLASRTATNRPVALCCVGDQSSVTIDLQIHHPMRGQVLLSINGGVTGVVHLYEYEENDCVGSYRLDADSSRTNRSDENMRAWNHPFYVALTLFRVTTCHRVHPSTLETTMVGVSDIDASTCLEKEQGTVGCRHVASHAFVVRSAVFGMT